MLNIRMQSQESRLKPKITVIGVGGAGGNAVNNMITSGLEGCEFLVCNTDAQALENSVAAQKIQLGTGVTRGLGAGANPEVGRAAAEETLGDIMSYLEGSNMVFVTAGMGGGTGTGAAPILAQAAREQGILTVGVVTKPFHFEGTHRMRLAESGIAEMQKYVDTLIVIPNQNLFRIANEKTTFADAFKMADEVLQSGVRGVTDLMVMPGLINLDFADIRAVMEEMGKAMMGTGEAEGEKRAIEAAEAAISNPLLDDVSMKGAKGVLINITGGLDMTLFEVDEAANRIRDEVDPDANIIFGSTFDESMQGKMRVSVVATGIEAEEMRKPRPQPVQKAPVSADAVVERRPAAGTRLGAGDTGLQQGSFGFAGARADGGAMPSYAAPQAQQQSVPVARSTVQQPMMSQPGYQQPTMNHPSSSQPYQTAPQMGRYEAAYGSNNTATARKLEENQMDIAATQTRGTEQSGRFATRPPLPTAPRRDIPPVGKPQAQRHGDRFIPPPPVDARGYETTEASRAPQKPVPPRKPVAEEKKGPSLFERFTGQYKKETPKYAPPSVSEEPQHKMSVEPGGKTGGDDDDLSIPAFLRRQAN